MFKFDLDALQKYVFKIILVDILLKGILSYSIMQPTVIRHNTVEFNKTKSPVIVYI